MRHVILTCKNHPNIRWSCKEIAFDDVGGYNSSRNIFFLGVPKMNEDGSPKMHDDMSGLDCFDFDAVECECPAFDLIRAPEDKLVRR